jgi:hypothetical protein
MSPARDIRFRLALWWDARTLPFRVSRDNLTEVLAIADGAVTPGLAGLPLADIIRRVKRTTRRPWLMTDRRCLREGLLAYRFLRAAGYKPELHFGVDRDSIREPSMRAHCWVVVGGEIVLNPPDPSMVTVLRH